MVSLLIVAVAVFSFLASLVSVYLLIQESTALTNGTTGIVTISSCEKTEYEWFCHGGFYAENGLFTIDDLTIYLDFDDEHARPGAQVRAMVAWPGSDQATQPGDWGNVGPYAVGMVGFPALGVFCLYLMSSYRSARRR